MLILRVDDVGRRPGDDPERGCDWDLSFFEDWCVRGGLVDVPAVYGVVPSWVDTTRIGRLRSKLAGTFAVHGFDHRQGAVVRLAQMFAGRIALDAVAYIPPFNAYSAQTVQDWGEAGGRYFFGGYESRVCPPGPPRLLGDVVFVPAYAPLYGHAATLLMTEFATLPDYPVVLTLHVAWEPDAGLVCKLIDRFRDKFVDISELERWL